MMKKYNLSSPFDYNSDYSYSINETEEFWNEVSLKNNIHWDKPYDKVLEFNKNSFQTEWFKGGKTNVCYNALDKNILNGLGNQVAFTHEIPIKNLKFKITYQELYERVLIFSGALINIGVKKGDIVLIYMHNCFETIIAMLSCLRIGAIHNVNYSGLLSEGLATNIMNGKPVLIIASTFGYIFDSKPQLFLPLLKKALEISDHKPRNIIIFQRNDIQDIEYKDPNFSIKVLENSIDWDEFIKNAEPLKEYEPVESNHPMYITYSSGTTNKPKGIVRETNAMVSIVYSTKIHIKINSGDSFFSGANLAWISSHSYLIYGTLLVGARSLVLEGPYRDISNDYWDMIARNKCNVSVFTPLIIRKLMKIDPECLNILKYDLTNYKHGILGGEKCNQQILDFITKSLKKPIFNEYFNTEMGWVMLSNSLGHPVKDTSIGKISPGYMTKIVSIEDSIVKELGENEIGEIVIKLPTPPGCTLSLFNDNSHSLYNENYLNKYKGYFATGDLGYYDKDGYFYFVSRVGDSITSSNHSVNCPIIEEEILNKFNQVLECCIIGIRNYELSEIPLILLILKNNNEIESIKSSVFNYFLNLIHAGDNFKPIVINVNNLCKNKNGKTIKPLMKSIFNGDKFVIPSEIENSDVVDELLQEYEKIKK